MSVFIGVISYLPEDTIIRNKRIAASRVQIDWLSKLFNNEKITIVAQNYTEQDYYAVDNVEYIKYENGIGAAQARNILLEKFYESDYDWIFLCDDDTIAYDYYSYQDFILDIVNNESKFKLIDAVSAVEPEYHPYKLLNYKDALNLSNYKFQPRELNSGSATSIIRNINKFYGKKVYYPLIDASTGEGREDIEFLMSWLKEGFNWYTMQTWIRKSLCFDYSSIFGKDTKQRDETLKTCLDNICDKYNLKRINGKIPWRKFNEKYNKSRSLLYIPRNRAISFTEKEKPKIKNNSGRLF